MYESHFGLRCRPFRPIADQECYYPATAHEAALTQLLQTIQDDEGLMILTGEPGSGKTILCLCLLDRLGEGVASVFLTHSHFGGRCGLLQAILYDLGIPYEGRSEQELRLTLIGYVLKNYEASRRTVVIVDEAQNLSVELLEELRLFTNLEGQSGKAFQALLVGQPALLETLKQPGAAAIDQCSPVRARLLPLAPDEAADYLYHHVRQAGGRPEEIFTDEAVAMLARQTRGNPRLLNRAAHLAFSLAHAAGGDQLDVEASLEALERLGCAEHESGEVVADIESPSSGVAATAVEASTARAVLILEDETPAEVVEGLEISRHPGRPRRFFAPPRRPA